MKLTEFIQATMEMLLEDWEEAVLEIAPDLKGEDSRVLRDHARGMLNFISQDLLAGQTAKESEDKALGHGKVTVSDAGESHGSERLAQGLTILQMAQELRALRARVTLAWSNKQGGLATKDIDELVRFNESIDQLIAVSMKKFSALREQETRLIETILNASADPAAIFKPDSTFLYLNNAMADLAGESPTCVVGKTAGDLGLDFAAALDDEIALTVSSGQSKRREIRHCYPSGREMYFECHFVPVFDDQNELEAIVNTARDITERKQNELQVWQSANFDDLTGVPNRRLFLDRLEQTLREAQRQERSFALLFIDLDRFKQTNDELGHEVGDRLLAQVADRISSSVRGMDTVARLGGDEFTLILKETDRDGAVQTAKTLLTSLEVAFDVDSHRVNISASIGVTVFPDDGKDVVRLLHNADQAMYAAKEQGGHQVKIYESWMTQIESDHMRLNRELHEAFGNNELEVYYQPIFDTHTGAVVRAEALIRWHHPQKGLLTPDAFLSVTDQYGMTDRVGNYVLEQASSCSSRWRNPNDTAFPISINEFPSSFTTRSNVESWRAQRTEISREESRITMELTPGSFNNIRASWLNPANDSSIPGARLRFSVNNFGIEPFSLSVLQNFAIESVKIDKELIEEAGQGGGADRILESIIAMAHAINVEVVGVGVENNKQLKFLCGAGCDYAQGFLLSQPLSQDDFSEFLKQNREKMLASS